MGELGLSGKVNRAFTSEKFSRVINRMYTGESRRGSLSEINEREPQPYPHQLTNIVEEEERQGSRSSQDKDTLEDKDTLDDKDTLEVEVVKLVEEREGKQTRAEDLKLNQVNPGPGNPMLDSKEPPKEFGSIPVKESKQIEETEVETELKQQPKEESVSEI